MSELKHKETPIQGTLNFIQHNLPGLDAGEYRLNVTQNIGVASDKEAYSNHYYFVIKGERFSLNPSDIYVMYPPTGTSGEYSATLPHIVFTKQTLPWIRTPTVGELPDPFFPDGQHDRDIPTWLAVFIFDEDDVTAYPSFQVTATPGQVKDLFAKRPPTQGQQQIYSYFFAETDLGPSSATADLQSHLDVGESPDDSCNYLDVPIKLFWDIAPSVDDLKMLAHIRNVDIQKKATQNGVPASRNDLSQIAGTSNFAVVVGNRLPQTGKRTTAHLVSLEGLAPFLPTDPASKDDASEVTNPIKVTEPAQFQIDADAVVRVVSLTSWSFTATGDGKRFTELLMQLKPRNADAIGSDDIGSIYDFSLGLPAASPTNSDSDAVKKAKNALEMGYTALGHHTRDGGGTVSWYRGPLLPYQVNTKTIPETFSSADQALQYDPDAGMFDISYAAAWQLGRLLALQDKHYSVMLYNWRRDNLRGVVAEMEKILAQQSLDEIQQQLRDDNQIYMLLQNFLPKNTVTANVNLGGTTSNIADLHRDVLTNADGLTQLMKDQLAVPFTVYSWLAKLKLLDGVPFNYLVSDEQMLPPESIRFFYIDMNWVHTLLDGALSIGRYVPNPARSTELSHDTAVKPTVFSNLDTHARGIRPTTLGVATADDQPDETPIEVVSGFVLRSEVVKGWPGLEVNGYANDDKGSLMDIVRFERLADTVLLCLFEKDNLTVAEIDIHEPAEGLHFGVTDTSETEKTVTVRYNHQVDRFDVGSQSDPACLAPIPFRGTNTLRLLRVFRLSKNLYSNAAYGQYISHDTIYEGFDHLPSSEFAMQMVKGVGMVKFNFQKKGNL